MRGQARLGDRTQGYCTKHEGHYTGYIITCSDDVMINQRGAARLGDRVLSNCGCTAYIITCSDSVYANNRGKARLGDRVGASSYSGEIITCSDNVEGDS